MIHGTWLMLAFKAVLPHNGTIVLVAVPTFTKIKSDEADNQVIWDGAVAYTSAAARKTAILEA